MDPGADPCHHPGVLKSLLVAVRVLVPAGDDDEPAPLRWVAPAPVCPAGEEVQAGARELAGRWPTARELQVEAFVEPHGSGWGMALTMVVDGVVHRQELEAESCPALAKAAALIIAVSIDPVASAAAVPDALVEPDAGPVVAEFAASSPPPTRSAPPRTDTPSRSRRPFVGLRWAGVLGMTPGLSSGPAFSLGLSGTRSRLAVHGRYVLPRRTEGGVARVQAGTVAAQACLASRPRPVRAHLCGAVEGGVLRADGVGLGRPRTAHYPWLAAVVGAGLRLPIRGRWSAGLDVEAATALFDAQVVRGSVDVASPDVVFANPRIGARALLGVEVQLFRPRE